MKPQLVKPQLVKPRLVHLTTTDISLSLLLGPQLLAFRDAGYEVIGVSAPGEFVAELEREGIRHVPLRNATRSMSLRRDLAAFRELIALFRELRPTIVHTHNPKPGVYGRIAARIARVPVIVNTVHGLYALPTDRLAKRVVVYSLERIAATFSQAELLQNIEDEPILRKLRIPSQRITILGNGIDLHRFNPDTIDEAQIVAARAEMGAKPSDVVVGCVGRLVWEKGYREVFSAAERLKTQAPNVRIVVVGPKDLDKADAITELDIQRLRDLGNVTFLGHRDDVEVLYRAFDVYVLASYREGFPRSAMEAAAMGCPVVATDIRGCRQVVDRESTGLLVPVHDAVALANAVGRLAASPDLRDRMGIAARAKAARDFDQRRVIDTTLGVYTRLMQQHGISV